MRPHRLDRPSSVYLDYSVFAVMLSDGSWLSVSAILVCVFTIAFHCYVEHRRRKENRRAQEQRNVDQLTDNGDWDKDRPTARGGTIGSDLGWYMVGRVYVSAP